MGNTDEIVLVTLGSEKPKRIRSPKTKLDIVLKDGSILQINANVVQNFHSQMIYPRTQSHLPLSC